MSPELHILPPHEIPGGALPLAAFRCDGLRVYVYPDRRAMGQAAARALVRRKRLVVQRKGSVTCCYAAAPSQNDVLAALVEDDSAPWADETCVLHMDEYLRMPADDPRSFRRYLNTHLFGPLLSRGRALNPRAVHLIRGDAADPEAEVRRYAELVRSHPLDVVQGGIGDGNAHIAFNDPPEARFGEEALVKIVELAPAAKQQQVNEGHYAEVDEIPPAVTLTVPALTRFAPEAGVQHVVSYWSCVAATAAKAAAVEKMLLGPVTDQVPASILRTLPDAALFLDPPAAARLRGKAPGL